METAICYFSGTGNSLFAAQQLKERLDGAELIPILQILKSKNKEIQADKVVLVFPVYALTLPLPIRQFLKEACFPRASYFSAIATRLGTHFNDFKRINRYLRPGALSSQFILNMGNNDVKRKDFRCPSLNELQALERKALIQLDRAAEIISNKEEHLPEDRNYLEALPFGDFRDRFLWWLMPKMMTLSKWIGGVNYFYVNNNCVGCGICQRICPAGKVVLVERRPRWNKKALCYMCYGCVNFCPHRAVEIESIPGVPSFSHVNERYSHPYASVEDLEAQR